MSRKLSFSSLYSNPNSITSIVLILHYQQHLLEYLVLFLQMVQMVVDFHRSIELG